jgi:hypothetical protein
MNPTLGRIVHYKTFDGFVFAAMIVDVNNEKKMVDLVYWTTREQLWANGVEQIKDASATGAGWFWPALDPATAKAFQEQMKQVQAGIRQVVEKVRPKTGGRQ